MSKFQNANKQRLSVPSYQNGNSNSNQSSNKVLPRARSTSPFRQTKTNNSQKSNIRHSASNASLTGRRISTEDMKYQKTNSHNAEIKNVQNKNSFRSSSDVKQPSISNIPNKSSNYNKPSNKGISSEIVKQEKSVTFIAASRTRQVAFSVNQNDNNHEPKRLLLVSSKCKYSAVLERSVKQNVVAVLYNYENTTYDSLLALVAASLKIETKFVSVACVATCKNAGLLLLHLNDSNGCLGSNTVITKSSGPGKFFKLLFDKYVEKNISQTRRLDFLGASSTPQIESCLKLISDLLGVPVGMCKDPMGIESYASLSKSNPSLDNFVLGELYFADDKIRNWKSGTFQTLDLFEKIRMVGKGAFGTAVLYRKKDDNSLVILKEINMTELNSQERQLAMNETRVLKLLNHPNIICYYDTFEENGVLMIEMEYADNGTLAQYLANPKNAKEEGGLLSEKEILSMFSQIVSGIKYMHEQHILHRDLKTANIFLTQDGYIKIGDFGVSKVMDSRNKAANTVLGTPYYISPEICEGKPYNEKSDIWALGCILHEMSTRQKTFEGTNLPALVNKIMHGQISPISNSYSKDFKDLVSQMLHRDPEPTAHDLEFKLLELMSRYDIDSDDSKIPSNSSSASGIAADLSNHKDTRSVLYYYNTSALALTVVKGFPSKIKIRQVAVGKNHKIVVSMERTVYTWGEGQKGQLGHGNLEPCSNPTIVEALKGKSIVMIACGDGFSVFVSDNGIVMTCGDGQYGCLGHGDYNNTLRPRLIESLLCVDVTAISSGLRHVVALGSEGEVFSWGEGLHGKLGLGHEENVSEPTEVTVEGVAIRDVRCGEDSTMFITELGTLLACGNNKHNKLGLNERKSFIMMISNRLKKTEVESRKVPTSVKSVKLVIDVAIGKNHTAVLTDPGIVYIFGSNKNGQMGTGDNKPHASPYLVKGLKDYEINTMVCGDKYTAVGVASGNVVYWGTRNKNMTETVDDVTSIESESIAHKPSIASAMSSVNNMSLFVAHGNHRRNQSSVSTISYSMNPDMSASEGPSRTSSCQDINSLDKPSSINLSHLRAESITSATEFDLESNASTATLPPPPELQIPDSFLMPTAILNIRNSIKVPDTISQKASTPDDPDNDSITASTTGLDMSKNTSDTVNFAVFLDTVIPYKDNLFILVETNAPLSLSSSPSGSARGKRKKSSMRLRNTSNLKVPKGSNNSTSSNEAGDEYTSSETSELDTVGSNPAWLKDMDMSDRYIINNTGEEDNNNISANTPLAQRTKLKNQIQKPDTLSPAKQAKTPVRRPSPSRQVSNERQKERHISSSDSAGRQPVIGAVTQKPAIKYEARVPSNTAYRLQVNRNRAKGNWNMSGQRPRPARSPVRNGYKDRDLTSQVNRLEKEKKAMEIKYEDLKLETENKLKNMQGTFEKEKQDQESKLKQEINDLRMQLNEQQQQLQASIDLLKGKQGKHLRDKPDSSTVKNSKICSIQ